MKRELGIAGCYECEPESCRKGLYKDKVKAELTALAEELGCETYNDQRVFGAFLERLGFGLISVRERITLGELELDRGRYCVLCSDRKEFCHLLPVVDGVIYDRRDDCRSLFVEAVYKETTK
ncbi:MAG: hypothetical protein IJ071_00695 [Ruminococcus sp.]|nr:hypothetical protein [Ruminococcus sp.]